MTQIRRIAFIGAGKMATAIGGGLVRSGTPKDRICAYDVSSEAAAKFTQSTGIAAVPVMADALRDAEIVLLAVKPQYAAGALAEAKPWIAGKLLISIAAGLTIDYLRGATGLDRVIRVMPNTPALVGEGMSCFTGAAGIAKEDMEQAQLILSAVGRSRIVAESQLDAVTGLSGSGPAYVLEFIMALADGGVYCGLTRDAAMELAIQTVLGTAKLCRDSGQSAAELRDAVISPAGTTARGIMALQNAGFKGIAATAVIKAAERSAELGKGK